MTTCYCELSCLRSYLYAYAYLLIELFISVIDDARALTGLSDAKATDEEQEISPEEATHRRAIEQEKTVYRESFDKLRVLKPEIEHIRKVGTVNSILLFCLWT